VIAIKLDCGRRWRRVPDFVPGRKKPGASLSVPGRKKPGTEAGLKSLGEDA
jgi:hypothetical protein